MVVNLQLTRDRQTGQIKPYLSSAAENPAQPSSIQPINPAHDPVAAFWTDATNAWQSAQNVWNGFGSQVQNDLGFIGASISRPFEAGGVVVNAGLNQLGADVNGAAKSLSDDVNAAGKSIGQAAQSTQDAWNSTLQWGANVQTDLQNYWNGLQQFGYNLQKNTTDFLKTGGGFLNALSGQTGLFPQIGASLPFIAIALIALAVLFR